MPKSSAKKLAYQKRYNKKPMERKRLNRRKAARYKMEKAGKVKRHDGKDVDHKRRNLKGNLSNGNKNLRVRARKKNRGWRKGKK